ncbi:MAG TPA: hydrolase, partial [Candidatus Thermoplasmatota archaeon]|nr:hydrolase [Candidatus Thermoplasmatota archaeon]
QRPSPSAALAGRMRLSPDDTVLLLVDMQERLQPLIHDDKGLRARAAALAEGCRLLGVPIVVTEQYPKGLGPTVPELSGAVEAAGGALAKTSFSCAADPAVRARLADARRPHVLLAGVEAHICVLQTALDLLGEGRRVHVVEDAVGSRAPHSREVGIARMRRHGAEPSCVETALFELMGGSRHPRFKEVQALIR